MTTAARTISIAEPCFGPEEATAVEAVLASGWVTQGPHVARFEERFAELHGARHAIATTSCTTALHLALSAMQIGPGDEVIVPAFTWVATANVVRVCGATPVLVDVCRDTFNVDVEQAAAAVTQRTRAVIPVHLFGLCADVPALRGAIPASVRILEDAACAAGARSADGPVGSLGDAACFSFHPRKAITTGEGGMITTNDAALAERMRCLRNHGASVSEEARHRGPRPYLLPDFDRVGFNYRMTDLQGAIGCIQIEKLEGFIAERARWAAWYRERLADIAWLRMPTEPDEGRHAWQAFVTFVDEGRAPCSRNAMMSWLQSEGIATRPGTHALHTLGVCADGRAPADFPVARACELCTLAIPLHNRMADADFERVAEALHAIDGGAANGAGE